MASVVGASDEIIQKYGTVTHPCKPKEHIGQAITQQYFVAAISRPCWSSMHLIVA